MANATIDRSELQRESLSRAVNGASMANYTAIFEGFEARGIPAADIRPRENVFTYNAWRALGRQVKRGEKGVKVCTWVSGKDKKTGAERRFPKSTTVFHVSQTKRIGDDD